MIETCREKLLVNYWIVNKSYCGGEESQGERQADPRHVGGGRAGPVPTDAVVGAGAGAGGRGVDHQLLLLLLLVQAEDDWGPGDDEDAGDEAAADTEPVEAAGLPEETGGQQHGDGGRGEGDGGEVSDGKSLYGSEDAEEHEAAQDCLAGDEQAGPQVREGEETGGGGGEDDGGDDRHLQTTPEQQELPGTDWHRADIYQLDGGVTRREREGE